MQPKIFTFCRDELRTKTFQLLEVGTIAIVPSNGKAPTAVALHIRFPGIGSQHCSVALEGTHQFLLQKQSSQTAVLPIAEAFKIRLGMPTNQSGAQRRPGNILVNDEGSFLTVLVPYNPSNPETRYLSLDTFELREFPPSECLVFDNWAFLSTDHREVEICTYEFWSTSESFTEIF